MAATPRKPSGKRASGSTGGAVPTPLGVKYKGPIDMGNCAKPILDSILGSMLKSTLDPYSDPFSIRAGILARTHTRSALDTFDSFPARRLLPTTPIYSPTPPHAQDHPPNSSVWPSTRRLHPKAHTFDHRLDAWPREPEGNPTHKTIVRESK